MTATGNRLLDSLPEPTKERLRVHLQLTHLRAGRALFEAGDTPRHVYFPTTSVLSFVAVAASGNTVEAAVADSYGCSASAIDAVVSPHRVLVQMSGGAYRVPGDAIRREAQRSEALRAALSAAGVDILAQCTQSLICMAFHPLVNRVARWLSKARARTHSNTLEVTHEFIGQMLGVSRPVVSQAMIQLETKAVIHQAVARIHIVDRRQLDALMCECWRNQPVATVEPVLTRR